MSVVGKGRGRGFAEVRDTSLRRPGQLFTPKFSDLINLFDSLLIEDIPETKIDDIVLSLIESIKNNTAEEVIDDLHKQSLDNREFGIKFARVFGNKKITSIDVKECNLRNIVLTTLQKDFDDREVMKKNNIFHFRNAISLFGELYNNLKIADCPIKCLLTPFLQYLELLLETSEEEDIELITRQISINGRISFEISESAIEDFVMHVRSVLIKRNLSAKSRGMLLFIIDLANQKFISFSGKLQEFYNHEVLYHDPNEFVSSDLKLKTNINDKSNVQLYNRPKNKSEQPNVENNIMENSIKTSRHGKISEFGINERSPPNERPVPRAIRGAGAADNTKERNSKKSIRGKKDKLTDEKIWSSKQNTNSKVWGHDDRFEKDYD